MCNFEHSIKNTINFYIEMEIINLKEKEKESFIRSKKIIVAAYLYGTII